MIGSTLTLLILFSFQIYCNFTYLSFHPYWLHFLPSNLLSYSLLSRPALAQRFRVALSTCISRRRLLSLCLSRRRLLSLSLFLRRLLSHGRPLLITQTIAAETVVVTHVYEWKERNAMRYDLQKVRKWYVVSIRTVVLLWIFFLVLLACHDADQNNTRQYTECTRKWQ